MSKMKLKKLIFYLTLPFVSLTILKISFRFISFSITLSQSIRNQKHQNSTIKIVTLGESTTADFFSDNKNYAWLRELERLLQEGGHSVQIINEGHAGSSTPYLLERIDSLLDKHKPDIVISMVGSMIRQH